MVVLSGSPSWRRGRCFLAVLAVLLVVGVVSPVGTTIVGGADAATTASVSPAVGLVDGQSVTVTGSSDADWVLAAVCPAALVDDALFGCLFSDRSVGVEPGAAADFSVELRVSVLTGSGATDVDCRTSSCELVVMGWESDLAAAEVIRLAIAFDPAGPLVPGPVLTIDPASGLVDGQTVQLTGSGFSGDWAYISQCGWDGGDQTCRNVTDAMVAPDGSFSVAVRVRASMASPVAGNPRIDCRTVAAGCTLAVSGGWRDPAPLPLSFDPSAPLLDPPVLTAEPLVDLVDGQTVEISGSGLEPFGYVFVQQCGVDPVDGAAHCRSGSGALPEVDGTGTVSHRVGVRATFTAYSGATIDCRSAACTLRVDADGQTWNFPLAFDPAAPLQPPPTISVTPSSGLSDGQTVTVHLAGFRVGDYTSVLLCQVGTSDCDWTTERWLELDSEAIDVEIDVWGSFDGPSTAVDCRVAPGCEIRASTDPYTAEGFVAAPVSFAAAPASRGRFLDPVFDEVEVQRDVVYRTTTDSQGRTVDLKMDIYQPVGDTLAARPVVMWMHGGWFIFGSKEGMADYAMASARRGYVAISLQYRLRPEITTSDLGGVVEAARDAYEDAYAAVEWIEGHASEFGIDTRAILVGGYSAGGVLSWNLSYPEDPTRPRSGIAGAAPIAGIPFSGPGPGSPPVIGFHAVDDPTVPIGQARNQCAAAVVMALVCEWIEYPDGGHGIVSSRRRDIIERSHVFFYEQVLAALGYATGVDPEPPRPAPTVPEWVGPIRPQTTAPVPTTSVPATTTSVPTTSVPTTSTSVPTAPTSVPTTSTTTSVPAVPSNPGDEPGQARPAETVAGRPSYAG